MNWGRIVDRRDQILMISLRPEARAASALFRRYPSTNGPFQTERDMDSALALVAPADNQLVRPLVNARLVTLGRLAPRCDRMTATGGPAFTTAMRVIDRVHDNAAVMRATSEPA